MAARAYTRFLAYLSKPAVLLLICGALISSALGAEQMKAICDRCGFQYKLEQLRKEWTGLMVCHGPATNGCWEPRNQQDFVRGVPDNQGVRPNMRPEPADVFIDVGDVSYDYPAPIAWDGVTKFRPGTRPGLNVVALAFEVERPIAASSWTGFMTSGRWSQIEAVAPGYIRIPFDPSPMFRTGTSQAELAPYIAAARTAIDDVLAHGLKALFTAQIATYSNADPTSNDAAIRASYPDGSLFRKVENVYRALASLLNEYPSDQVGFEVYNETTATTNTPYAEMLQRLETVIRVRNKRTTLVFAPCRADLFDGFTASMFGANSGFAVHSYIPTEFTYQALVGSGYAEYISQVAFPAVEADRAPAKTRATNAINADGDLSPSEKTAMIAFVTSQLDYYFNSFGASRNATFTYFFGSTDGTDPGEQLGLWIEQNGVDARDINITEFGVGTGAPAASRAAYFEFTSDWWAARGWSSAIWVEDDSSFGIRSGADFDPDLTAAVGWTPNYLSLLQDDFSAGTLNTELWSTNGDTAVSSSRAEMPMHSDYDDGFTSVRSGYQFIDSHISFEAGFVGGDSSFNLAIEVRDLGASANSLIFSLEAFNVAAIKRVAGVTTTLFGGVTYDATNHAWIRLRESAGTVYWETSANGTAWSTFYSAAMPSGLTMSSVSASFNAGAWNDQTGVAWVDNVNV